MLVITIAGLIGLSNSFCHMSMAARRLAALFVQSPVGLPLVRSVSIRMEAASRDRVASVHALRSVQMFHSMMACFHCLVLGLLCLRIHVLWLRVHSSACRFRPGLRNIAIFCLVLEPRGR